MHGNIRIAHEAAPIHPRAKASCSCCETNARAAMALQEMYSGFLSVGAHKHMHYLLISAHTEPASRRAHRRRIARAAFADARARAPRVAFAA